ncbi:MAG: GC-type dockerin domain-anchored protein [Pseudomonadota bacterium]
MRSLRVLLPGVAALMTLGTQSALAQTYEYEGDVTLCTTTCDSFAALSAPMGDDGTVVAGTIDITVAPSGSFTAADVGNFDFSVTSSLAPLEDAVFGPDAAFPDCLEGQLCNPATANPLPLDPTVVAVREMNTAGTVMTGGTADADGELDSGTLLLEFTQPPFSSNGAWVIFDLATGFGQVCLFFDSTGCIPLATETVNIEGGYSLVTPATYDYDGFVTLCTSTCDSFASLSAPMGDDGTTVAGSIDITVDPSSSFDADDIGDFAFQISSSLAPMEAAIFAPDPDPRCDGLPDGLICNPTTANPLPLDPSVAVVRAQNTAGTEVTGGTTDANGELDGGQILIEFTVPPFSSNGAWVILDVGTGFGQVCLFFDGTGCIPMATETVNIDGAFSLAGAAPDTDGDGVTDDVDNCILDANPLQIDSNGDNIGNVCDADIAGPAGAGADDCQVNFFDLGQIKNVFFTTDPDADLVGPGNSEPDGQVNFFDLGRMKEVFFAPPGPSAAGCDAGS